MAVDESKRQVVVTGASGFLGSQIVRKLLEGGFYVKAVLRDGPQKRELPLSVLRGATITEDVFNQNVSWWQEVCEGSFAVVHSAWYSVAGEYAHATENLQCLTGSLSLAQGALAAGVSKFVGIGSCFEYDLSGGPATIETGLQPESLYAASKVALFHVLSNLLRAESIEFVWARVFYLYGEGEHSRRLFPYLHDRLSKGLTADLSDGAQIRDYLDVEVAASRIVALLEESREGPVNICSGEGISVREFAERIAADYGANNLLQFGARERSKFDPDFAVGA